MTYLIFSITFVGFQDDDKHSIISNFLNWKVASDLPTMLIIKIVKMIFSLIFASVVF